MGMSSRHYLVGVVVALLAFISSNTAAQAQTRGSTAEQALRDLTQVWSKEIERRVAELDAGTVETISWEEVRAELFGQQNDRQVPSGSP